MLEPIDRIPEPGEVLEGWYKGYRWERRLTGKRQTLVTLIEIPALVRIDNPWVFITWKWHQRAGKHFLRTRGNINMLALKVAVEKYLPPVDELTAFCLEFGMGAA